MASDGGTLEVLDTDECLRLLATQVIGRLGLPGKRFPLILPVNYKLDRGVIVIRTHPGSALTAADHANVAFEVDEIDRRTRSGWSVLVHALAEEVTDAHRAELVERTHATGVKPWAPGEHDHWLRLIPQEITGRRIVAGQLPTLLEMAAYL
jgi:nitroimidazol reductase NimA-like FMN-containing flavoprotein (pyridoxamine 5'-phosphate oxidase superfamily)